MEYINLGNTGLKVSRLSLGCMMFGSSKWRNWVLDEADARPVIKAALDAGINYFDTADQYSMGASEEVTGRALRDMAKRDEIVVSTKVYTRMGDMPTTGGLSRKHIMDSIDASLKRLGLDYVDLFICHKWDREEEREMIPFCDLEGVAFTPWSPLARGLLAGLHHPDYGKGTLRAENDKKVGTMYGSDTDLAIVDRVIKLAKARKLKPAQIALAWIMQKPNRTIPIVGADSPEQLNDLIAATDVTLSDDEIMGLEELYQPKKPFQDSLKGLPQGVTPYSAASS